MVIDPRDKCKIIESARYAAGRLLTESAQFVTKKMEEVELDELLDCIFSS